jgi:hypothetical protein
MVLFQTKYLEMTCGTEFAPAQSGEQLDCWRRQAFLGAIVTKVIIIRIVEGMAVEGFLIVSGALAMLIGLVAMIEGNLHCFGSMRHKKK